MDAWQRPGNAGRLVCLGPGSNPHRNLEGEGQPTGSPNLTIPEMRGAPKNVPPPGGKIGKGGRGALLAAKALQGVRNRQHFFLDWRRTKSHA